ncbi:helix-turn-helix domain-containing protein [Azospirillum sp. 412522]|nr:helix-turn-helix domain-containing protein [Azospirillum sp. 412522]MBY6265551.1 helix-turn-helix domain-containing protein [Azospirillum sp. 412522]
MPTTIIVHIMLREAAMAYRGQKSMPWPNSLGGYGLGWKALRPEVIDKVIELKAAGRSQASIARELGLAESTVSVVVRGHRPKTTVSTAI